MATQEQCPSCSERELAYRDLLRQVNESLTHIKRQLARIATPGS